MQFRVIVVTDPQTHATRLPTAITQDKTGPMTTNCAADSAQCNEYVSLIIPEYQRKKELPTGFFFP